MNKADRLLEMTTASAGTKKWKVVAGIVVGVGIACCLFILSLNFVDVDGYVHDTKQLPTLYEFYAHHQSINETEVFFLGNSMVGFSVYPPLINSLLFDEGYNISTYNLQMSGGGYKEYILQLSEIIKAKPELVVIGTTYVSFGNGTSDYGLERLNLFYNISDVVGKDYYNLFDDAALEELKSPLGIMDYKKYIFNSMTYKFGLGNFYTNDYSTDPIGYEYRQEFDRSRVDDQGIIRLVELYPAWHQDIGTSSDNSKLALEYLSEALNKSGIAVVYVSLPLHPSHSEKVTDVARSNYHNYLNQTGYNWYDFENDYNNSYLFRDHAHMSFDGARAIAPAWADLIIQELS